MTSETGPRHEPRQAPHERAPDPQEGEDRPLEAKDRPPDHDSERDPHESLNKPVGETDPDATADPYDTDPESQGDRER